MGQKMPIHTGWKNRRLLLPTICFLLLGPIMPTVGATELTFREKQSRKYFKQNLYVYIGDEKEVLMCGDVIIEMIFSYIENPQVAMYVYGRLKSAPVTPPSNSFSNVLAVHYMQIDIWQKPTQASLQTIFLSCYPDKKNFEKDSKDKNELYVQSKKIVVPRTISSNLPYVDKDDDASIDRILLTKRYVISVLKKFGGVKTLKKGIKVQDPAGNIVDFKLQPVEVTTRHFVFDLKQPLKGGQAPILWGQHGTIQSPKQLHCSVQPRPFYLLFNERLQMRYSLLEYQCYHDEAPGLLLFNIFHLHHPLSLNHLANVACALAFNLFLICRYQHTFPFFLDKKEGQKDVFSLLKDPYVWLVSLQIYLWLYFPNVLVSLITLKAGCPYYLTGLGIMLPIQCIWLCTKTFFELAIDRLC
ncbi:MAG: hypothetical protein ACPGC9_00960 [Cytophagales bacterium]